jgi:hypothetical protein
MVRTDGGMHIEGAGGECAVAKALKLYWSGSVDTFKREGDVGDLEVRTRSEDWHELLIRPDDPSAIYVLVVGKIPHFRLVGWIHSSVAKQRNDWLKPHGGRPPAYFVPQSELRPIEELQRRNVYNASPAIDLDTRRHRTLEEGS